MPGANPFLEKISLILLKFLMTFP